MSVMAKKTLREIILLVSIHTLTKLSLSLRDLLRKEPLSKNLKEILK